MPPIPYIQCLVCGRLTPIDRGVCYHCHSPLPSKVTLPPGMIVCPNCLKVTPVDTGYCRHCRAPLPSFHANVNQTPTLDSLTINIDGHKPHTNSRNTSMIIIGPIGNSIRIGAIDTRMPAPRRLRIVRGYE